MNQGNTTQLLQGTILLINFAKKKREVAHFVHTLAARPGTYTPRARVPRRPPSIAFTLPAGPSPRLAPRRRRWRRRGGRFVNARGATTGARSWRGDLHEGRAWRRSSSQDARDCHLLARVRAGMSAAVRAPPALPVGGRRVGVLPLLALSSRLSEHPIAQDLRFRQPFLCLLFVNARIARNLCSPLADPIRRVPLRRCRP